MKLRTWVGTLVLSGLLVSSGALAAGSQGTDDYDRLDGMGASGKKVDVVEWEGNLEIHVTPAGSLKGLALKLDTRDKNKLIMVIGYRFDDNPSKQLIRRAILGIPLHAGFKTYRDPNADDYDKIVITNNNLDSVLASYKTDPPPTQLYPDGYDAALAQAQGGATAGTRSPANDGATAEPRPTHQQQQDDPDLQDSGTITPFFEQAHGHH